MTLRFNYLGVPQCAECQAHQEEEHERLRASFRAVLAPGEPPRAVTRPYFTAFHDGGHLKSDDWDAVDAADPRPRSAFQRWRDSQ